MTGPLAQQFAQVREAMEEAYSGLIRGKQLEDASRALSAIERHVQEMEMALERIVETAEPREWETPGHPMNEWTKREPVLRIARAALPAREKGTEA